MIEEIFKNRFVYKTKYPKLKNLVNILVPAIEENILPEYNHFEKMKGICCLVKNNKYPLVSKLPTHIPWLNYLDDINHFVETHIKEYVKIAESKLVLPKIEGIWFSYYPNETFFDYHSHLGVSAVAVLYLEKKPNAGNLWIKETDEDESIEIIGEEGELIIFPGFLPHKTTPNLSGARRIVITYDIMYLDV